MPQAPPIETALALIDAEKILVQCGDKVRSDDSIRYPYKDVALQFLYHAQCHVSLTFHNLNLKG